MISSSSVVVVGRAGRRDHERDHDLVEELVLLADDRDLADAGDGATTMSSTSRAETFSPPTFSRSLSRSR